MFNPMMNNIWMFNGMQGMNPMNMMNMMNMNMCNFPISSNPEENNIFKNVYFQETQNSSPPILGSKVTITFKTTQGVRNTITLDKNKSIKEMILIYLQVVNHPELFGNIKVFFLFNANKINIYDDQTTIGNYFCNKSYPIVIVNDVKNLIGA